MADEHRSPWDCVLAKDEEGGCLPGERPTTDQQFFEILCLCILQAGLNWSSVRKHWPRYRKGFMGFDPRKLAKAQPETLIESPDVIRHPRKLAAVVHNAREFRSIAKEHGSFARFLETLRPLDERARLEAVAKHFKHVGPETADYFLHAVGFAD
jgi:DNA-3-methyladenine glycosylase I